MPASDNPDMCQEDQRVKALQDLNILDTTAEREFDNLTRLAATAFRVKWAAVTLIDQDRQWFKSKHGFDRTETARDVAFCDYTVAMEAPFVVPDATLDDRLKGNPYVLQPDGVRFYAGMPLTLRSGHTIGALCVFDPTPRSGVTREEQALLSDFAEIAVELIESRRGRLRAEIAEQVMSATSDAVLATDLEGKIVFWNAAAEHMFHRRADEVLGESVEIIMPARFLSGHHSAFSKVVAGDPARLIGKSVELAAVRADGSEFPIEFSLGRWGEEGRQGFAAVVRDISQRKALEQEREHAKAFLANVVRNLPAMLFVKDADSRKYVEVNEAGETLIGLPSSEIVGKTDRELFPEYGAGYEARDAVAIESPRPTLHESVFVGPSGRPTHLRTTRTLIDGPDRKRQYILGISEDVTETRQAEAEILRLAHHDALTGLLNRASYIDRLHRAVKTAVPFALLSVDLDRFKAVNEQFGHPTGDAVLTEIGRRLTKIVGDDGWLARIGGDEFIAVLTCADLEIRAPQIADQIVGQLSQPYVTPRGVGYCGASVGCVLMPRDGTTTDELRENVDLALYRAKHGGKGMVCFFNNEMDSAARDRREIERGLHKALADRGIGLVFQPLVSAKTGQITSAEALARWTHPTMGPIRPDVFISVAEECGLIDRIGESLLDAACHEATAWPSHIRVAVNLSPLQFVSGRLVDQVRHSLQASGLAPNRLQLEVTEGLVIRDVEGTFRQLEELRTLGIQVLIDDFGVGYSSLSYFERFPFDKVKIDKSFVDTITSSRASKAIVQAVVGLGNELGMGVVAEGVETEEQMHVLIKLGCTHLQGYLFGRPLPSVAFRDLIAATQPGPRLQFGDVA